MSTQPLDISTLKRSDLNGFWLRLKKLGYKPGRGWFKSYNRPETTHTYSKTFWSFTKGQDKIIFSISPHGYYFIIRKDGAFVMRSPLFNSWSLMELPFMEWFEEDKPLQLQRLSVGQQLPKVKTWLLEKRKRAQKIEAVGRKSKGKGLAPKPMPVSQVKPKRLQTE
jgi:hypothetical protein